MRCHLLPALLTSVALLGACTPSEPAAPPAAVGPPVSSLSFVPPLNDAQVGEEIVLARGTQEWLYRVTQATDTEVVVQVLTYDDGTPSAEPITYRWSRNGFGVPEDAVVRRIEPARVELGGERIPCWMLHVYTRRGTFACWVSEDAPVHGLLKMAKVEDGRPVDAHALVRVR